MTDKRKLAVSYGSFSCVIEGFDDPFNLMRDIISFYYQVSQEEPEFAHFHQIVDMQELKTLLQRDLGEEIELEPIAGGVYARRIEAPARLAGEIEAPARLAGEEARAHASAERDEGTAPRQYDDAGAGDDYGDFDSERTVAATFGLGSDADTGPEARQDQAATAPDPETDQGAEPEEARADDEVRQDNGADDEQAPAYGAAPLAPEETSVGDEPAAEEEGEDTGSTFGDRDRDEVHAAADAAEEPDAGPDADHEDEDEDEQAIPEAMSDETDQGDAAETAPEEVAENGPIRLYDAVKTGGDAQPEAADDGDEDAAAADGSEDDGSEDDGSAREQVARDAGPIRLGVPLSGPRTIAPAGAKDETRPAEPPRERLTLGAALRLGPADAVSGPTDESAEKNDEDDSDASAFIARVAEKEETRDLLTTPTPGARKADPDEDSEDVSIAQIRSDMAAAEEEEKPKKSGGLRMGNLLRRKSASQESDESGGARDTAEKPTIGDSAATAEKPRSFSSGKLRVIRSGSSEEEQADDREDDGSHAAAAEPDSPRAGTEPEPPRSEPAPEPDVQAATAERSDPEPRRERSEPAPEERKRAAASRSERDATRGGDTLTDRLHASFDSKRAPTSAKDAIDLSTGEMQDPYSPRGFAQRVEASSATDLIASATAFRILVDGKSAVTRTDIMETVQMIMGDKPLSAEAKVKAFGKLVRGGDLTRVDGGEFTLSPELLDTYQQRFEAARKSNVAGS